MYTNSHDAIFLRVVSDLLHHTHNFTAGVCGGTTQIDYCGLCGGDSSTCASTAMIETKVFPHQGYPSKLALEALSAANATNATNATNTTGANAVPAPPPPPDPCEGVEEGFCTCAHPARRLSLLFGVGAKKNKAQWCNDRYVRYM